MFQMNILRRNYLTRDIGKDELAFLFFDTAAMLQ